MSDTRKKQETRLIILLAMLCILVYGLSIINISGMEKRQEESRRFFSEERKDLKEIQVVLPTESYSLLKKDGRWEYAEKSIPVNQAQISLMIDTFFALEPLRTITKGAEKPAGIEEGAITAQITFIDQAGSVSVSVGQYNNVLDEYYVSVQGLTGIHMVASSSIHQCVKSLLDLIGEPEITATESIQVKGYSVSGPAGAYSAVRQNDTQSFSIKQDGVTYESSGYKTLGCYSMLKAIDYTQCATYCATEEELRNFGLLTPEICIDISMDSGEVSACIGTNAEKHYIRFGESEIVYVLSERDYVRLSEAISLEYILN